MQCNLLRLLLPPFGSCTRWCSGALAMPSLHRGLNHRRPPPRPELRFKMPSDCSSLSSKSLVSVSKLRGGAEGGSSGESGLKGQIRLRGSSMLSPDSFSTTCAAMKRSPRFQAVRIDLPARLCLLASFLALV